MESTMTTRERYEFYYHLARKHGSIAVPDKPDSPESMAQLQAWRSMNNRALTFDADSWHEQRMKWRAWWNRVRSNQIKDIKARYRSYLCYVVPGPTPAVFRADDAGNFALFPFDPATLDSRDCTSYQHIGQHSAANYRMCLRSSHGLSPKRSSMANEAGNLVNELIDIGYQLVVLSNPPEPMTAQCIRQWLIADRDYWISQRQWQFMGRKRA